MMEVLRSGPAAAVSAVVVALAVAAALLAGVVSPRGPLETDTARRLEAPGAAYLLGSDNLGRDVLSRVLHGTRTALAVAVGGVATGAVVGTAVGIVSAYRGGWLDLAVQRVVDVLLGFPLLALAVVVIVSLGVSAWSVAVAIAPSADAPDRPAREVVDASCAGRRTRRSGGHRGREPAARVATPRAASQHWPGARLCDGICVDGPGDGGCAELPGPGRSTADTVLGAVCCRRAGSSWRWRHGSRWPLPLPLARRPSPSPSWATRWGSGGAPGGGDGSPVGDAAS